MCSRSVVFDSCGNGTYPLHGLDEQSARYRAGLRYATAAVVSVVASNAALTAAIAAVSILLWR